MAPSVCHLLVTLGVFFFLPLAIHSLTESSVKELNEDNWRQMLEGEWMVEFFAPWCPACKALQSIWQDFARWNDDLGIDVGQVDVTTSPGLSGRFMVTALPTIYHVKNGEFRQYHGSRDKDDFISYIEEKKWQETEPISSWKSPSSVQMSLVSNFFKLSMVLRTIHTKLTEEYGIPFWGSYILFALATIIIGAVLGLVLVCIIDFVYPPKVIERKAGGADERDNNREMEDDVDDGDVIEDDEEELDDGEESQKEEEEEEEEEEEGIEKTAGQESENASLRKRKARNVQ